MSSENQNEVWLDVKGYEGLYQVSNFGRVRSLNYRGAAGNVVMMKPTPNNRRGGYLTVLLTKDKLHKRFYIHRLVAEAFIPNPNNYTEINHKDEDPTNNNISNIEWCDRSYNTSYGTRNSRSGEKHRRAVVQYTLDGMMVKEWVSGLQIEKELGFSHSAIRRACNGTYAQAYGFKWRNANQNETHCITASI